MATLSVRSRTAMRARSWMAALALIVGTTILIGRGFSAQGLGPAQDKAREVEPKKSKATPPQGEAAKSPDSLPDQPQSHSSRAWAREDVTSRSSRRMPAAVPRPIPQAHRLRRQGHLRIEGCRDPQRRPCSHHGDHGTRARPGFQDRLSRLPDVEACYGIRLSGIVDDRDPQLDLLSQLPLGRRGE